MTTDTWVLKVDGKANGKGVLISTDWNEVTSELFRYLQAGSRVTMEKLDA